MGKGATFCQFKEVLLGIVVTCYMYRLQLYNMKQFEVHLNYIKISISNQNIPSGHMSPYSHRWHGACTVL